MGRPAGAEWHCLEWLCALHLLEGRGPLEPQVVATTMVDGMALCTDCALPTLETTPAGRQARREGRIFGGPPAPQGQGQGRP